MAAPLQRTNGSTTGPRGVETSETSELIAEPILITGTDRPVSSPSPSPRTLPVTRTDGVPALENKGLLLLQPPTELSRLSSRRQSPLRPGRSRLASSASIKSASKLHENWIPRRLRKWESPLLIVGFFIGGLIFSIAHCVFYTTLDGTIVGNPGDQENNLRVGTAMAFLAQITFTACVWQTYTQGLWRHLRRPLPMSTLNDMFGAQTSVLSFLNLDFFRQSTLGYIMALFAWSLILPPFFTPGTLVIYDSTDQVKTSRLVPYLAIANSTNAHSFAFSPSIKGDRFSFADVLTRVFNGPRTIVTMLSTATASPGTILSIPRPANHSSYSLSFFAPAVQCAEANATTTELIKQAVQAEMVRSSTGRIFQKENAYYAFVPSTDPDNVVAGAQDDVRFQAPSRASNEIWMAFQRYDNTTTNKNCDYKPYYQVCSLWNATVDLNLSWESDFQNITGKTTLMHQVPYPSTDEAPGTITEMSTHAYAAYFWALSNQLVGSFALFQENITETENRLFPLIRCPIQHNSLLGSSDLNVFFDYNEETGACQKPYANLSAQRRQDVDVAKGRTMGELIEELAFNLTVSLMHNDLLTNMTERLVTEIRSVNRYGYNPYALWIPYGLASFFTLITAVIGTFAFCAYGAMPSNKFQDLLSAAEQGVIRVAPEPEPESEPDPRVVAASDRGDAH